MNIVERYETEFAETLVSIVVKYERDKPFPYLAVSSLHVDGVGKSVEEAKEKCENATRIEINVNG